MNNKQELIKSDSAPTVTAAKVLKGGKTVVRVDGITVDGSPFFVGGSRADRAEAILITYRTYRSYGIDVAARGSLHTAQVEAARNRVSRKVKSSRYGNYTTTAAVWSVAIPVTEERVA